MALRLRCDCMVFCLVLIKFGCSQDFGYEGSEGPTHWGDKYAKCVGKLQSPIDIDAVNVTHRKFPPLIFEKFDKILDVVSLENNGHTVVLKIKNGEVPTLRGGPLRGIYKFVQLHFHWGPNDTLGSENQINHHSFPLEIHVVMINRQYENMSTAINFKDGLTVLSFLYSATNEDNAAYEQFEEGLLMVQNMSSSTEIPNFVSLQDFTTQNTNVYFTYEGSLTTPPCSEAVTWIEFSATVPLSKEQIKAFRLLLTHGGSRLTHNFRPVQPIYGRIIYRSASSAYGYRSNALIVILAFIYSYF